FVLEKIRTHTGHEVGGSIVTGSLGWTTSKVTEHIEVVPLDNALYYNIFGFEGDSGDEDDWIAKILFSLSKNWPSVDIPEWSKYITDLPYANMMRILTSIGSMSKLWKNRNRNINIIQDESGELERKWYIK